MQKIEVFAVDEEFLSSLLNYQKKISNIYIPGDNKKDTQDNFIQSYRVYSLAKAQISTLSQIGKT